MKRITTSALAVLLAAGLAVAGSGSASGFGGSGKTQGGGVGCCLEKQ